MEMKEEDAGHSDCGGEMGDVRSLGPMLEEILQ